MTRFVVVDGAGGEQFEDPVFTTVLEWTRRHHLPVHHIYRVDPDGTWVLLAYNRRRPET